MLFRTHVTFGTDIPDDACWDESGSLSSPGGRNIALIIREQLVARGIHSSNVFQRFFYGWECVLSIEGQSFVCVVQRYADGQWLLICEPRAVPWWRTLVRRHVDVTPRCLATIHDALSSQSSILKVRWHYREQFERGDSAGAATPA